MIRLLALCTILLIGSGCSGGGGGTGGGSAGGTGGGAAGGSGGGGGGSGGGVGGGTAGGTGGGSGMPFLLSIDANGGNTQNGSTPCSVFQFAALPNGAFVATCTGVGYLMQVYISTPSNPMLFAKAAEFDRTTLGVSPTNINNAAAALMTLPDNSVLFLMGHQNGGVKSIKLPAGASAFEAPVAISAVAAGTPGSGFVTAQSPGAGVLAFFDGVNIKLASTTNGNNWTLTPGLVAGSQSGMAVPQVRVDGAGNAYVVADNAVSNATGAVFGKATGGTWVSTTLIANRITTLAVSPNGQKVMLHHLPTGKIWVSTDSGMTFPAATAPTATSTELAAPLTLGAFALSDGSHGVVEINGSAGAITAKWCSSPDLLTWTCALAPGDAHLLSGGFPVAATVTSTGSVWAASPRGIGRLR